MYECFHCGSRSVVWSADFSFEDFDYEGDGIVHMCHCTNCGAEIEYKVPLSDAPENDHYNSYHSGDSDGTGKGK